jgi:hypothetical protein
VFKVPHLHTLLLAMPLRLQNSQQTAAMQVGEAVQHSPLLGCHMCSPLCMDRHGWDMCFGFMKAFAGHSSPASFSQAMLDSAHSSTQLALNSHARSLPLHPVIPLQLEWNGRGLQPWSRSGVGSQLMMEYLPDLSTVHNPSCLCTTWLIQGALPTQGCFARVLCLNKAPT